MNPNQFWFLNCHVTIRVSESEGTDGVSILEHRVPPGDSPPLHFHVTEDEIFQILDGEFRMKVQEKEQRIGPGAILLVPKGVPHTYRAESKEGGRFLTVTARGEFERFVRFMGRPAERAELPPPTGLSPEAIHSLTVAAAKYGIEIIGPPLG
jgi:mannose-6-phosphate isomerase-like protein (cupin superfamily)